MKGNLKFYDVFFQTNGQCVFEFAEVFVVVRDDAVFKALDRVRARDKSSRLCVG